jgi:hypothetical protein
MPVITPGELIDQYLFGITLTIDGTPTGTPFPQSLLDNAIASGVAMTETVLDIVIDPIIFDGSDDPLRLDTMRNANGHFGSERHDYHFTIFDRVELRRRPVRRVRRVAAHYLNSELLVFPAESVLLHSAASGLVRLVPTRAWSMAITDPRLLGAGFAQRSPDFFRVDYEAGFHPVEYPLPLDIRHYVALRSSFNILNPAGDLVVGAGIASKSMSFDGFSESVNTTSSAENAAYSSRLIQYAKELAALEPRLRNKYGGISMGVV